MRRPGTLPVANTASGHRGGGSGTGGSRGVVVGTDDGTASLGAAPIDRVASNGERSSHYTNHSLRRAPHSQPQLTARESPDDRMRTATTLESGLQNGAPIGGRHLQPSPPPLPSRHHQLGCVGQSAYPTMPVNGHAAHHYHHHHHARERDKDRASSARERNHRDHRDSDASPPPPPPPPPMSSSHRSDKHREAHLEMELRNTLDLGTYRA